MSPRRLPLLLTLLPTLLLFGGGCAAPVEMERDLLAPEREGLESLIEATERYGAATGDALAVEVSRALRDSFARGRMFRGKGGHEDVMAVTEGDRVWFDERVPLTEETIERDLSWRCLALSIAFHEGVHLTQPLELFLFGDPEEEAYLATHRFQIWLAREAAAGRELPGSLDEGLRALERVRGVSGEDYLRELCPAHRRQDHLRDLMAAPGAERRGLLELPARDEILVFDGEGSRRLELPLPATLDLAVVSPGRGAVAGRSTMSSAPPRPWFASLEGTEILAAWHAVEGPLGDETDAWNRDRPRLAVLGFENGALEVEIRAPGPGRRRLIWRPVVLLGPGALR